MSETGVPLGLGIEAIEVGFGAEEKGVIGDGGGGHEAGIE